MNFDDLLKTLHHDYLTSLPKKILSIREQMKSGSAHDLRESFHKLKGTGRTYGMPEVSDLAAVVEQICLEKPQHAVSATSHGLDLLEAIYGARASGNSFDLETDSRFTEIRKLLQK